MMRLLQAVGQNSLTTIAGLGDFALFAARAVAAARDHAPFRPPLDTGSPRTGRSLPAGGDHCGIVCRARAWASGLLRSGPLRIRRSAWGPLSR